MESDVTKAINRKIAKLKSELEAADRADALLPAPYVIEPDDARTTACVRACEGIPTESLTDGVVGRLVEALDAIVSHDPETCNGIMPRDCVESMREIAAAALAELSKEVKDGE